VCFPISHLITIKSKHVYPTHTYINLRAYPRGKRKGESGENCVMRCFMICPSYRTLVGLTILAEWGVWGMWRIWGREEMHIIFWMEKPEGKNVT
jgi:hypothetical protein